MQNILADIQYIPELVKTQWEVSELMNSTFVIWYVDISIRRITKISSVCKYNQVKKVVCYNLR